MTGFVLEQFYGTLLPIMRFKTIKLSGFKSFVDPTTISFPSNLVAIVGHNGSGKSNVIDAVRWVLGESSPRYLRSESMADVIFNGSSTRKPVGQASVELLFDNSSGGFGGAYAQYDQITLKRVVTRASQSDYYLNGVRCRRRDIIDLFLGTGLAGCSYAIVMQDTVSRLIEAKPDELRAYLEESAGISKYKERRRETEQHIKHTKENLARVNDLCEELVKQLSHLQQQAQAAERYQKLRQEERLLQGQLFIRHWQVLDEQWQAQQHQVTQAELSLETQLAQLQALAHEVDGKNKIYRDESAILSQLQENYYQSVAENKRLAQEIQFQQTRYIDLSEQQTHTAQKLKHIQEQLSHKKDRQQELVQQEMLALAKVKQAQEFNEASDEALQAAEEAMHDWQISWDEFNQQAAQRQQQGQIIKTRIEHLQQRKDETQQRLQKLKTEENTSDLNPLTELLPSLVTEIEELAQQQHEKQSKLQELQQEIVQQNNAYQKKSQELDQARTQLQQLRGQLASLTALQQATLNSDNANLNNWLEQQQLNQYSRLATLLEVETGWEHAVEIVLGRHLQGFCVPGLAQYLPAVTNAPEGSLTLIEIRSENIRAGLQASFLREYQGKSGEGELGENSAGVISLATKVKAESALLLSLLHVYTSESYDEACQIAATLNSYESVITRDGIWLGKGWIYKHGKDNAKAGIIQRQRELTQLQKNIQTADEHVEILVQDAQRLHEHLQQLEQHRHDDSHNLRTLNEVFAQRQAELQVKQAELAQKKQRVQEIHKSLEEIQTFMTQLEADLTHGQTQWQEAQAAIEIDASKREDLTGLRQENKQNLETIRNKVRDQQEQFHELTLQHRTVHSELSALPATIEHLTTEIAHLEAQNHEIGEKLKQLQDPELDKQAQLEEAQNQQFTLEQQVQTAKHTVANLEEQVQLVNKTKVEAEKKSENSRAQLEKMRFESQRLAILREEADKRLTESNYDRAELAASENKQTLEELEQTRAKILRRIENLGPINMAALDEHAKLLERKTYLDNQQSDLNSALQTLENAIHKIDQETHFRFKTTYEKVNAYFADFFPRVFGGGQAHLALTSDDMLEAGVTIVASPPGKRTSHIHLLSGGEKALTALTLIFSLFQLNPAPFCLLDEVDAALDDVNISRFCNLVREMSKQVQFIFISHNKLTITLADQLIGVTMGEPGVSRIVAVDVEAAAAMVGA